MSAVNDQGQTFHEYRYSDLERVKTARAIAKANIALARTSDEMAARFRPLIIALTGGMR